LEYKRAKVLGLPIPPPAPVKK